MGTVDVCIGNNLIIDFDIYTQWVEGYSIDECKASILRKSNQSSSPKNVKEHIVLKDIVDHYYVFNKLEQFLHTPQRLKEQLIFQITDEITDKLIEKYYEYDNLVIRELLGHKLSQRQRKDLDEICEKANIRVKSCRRQFDNLKRIVRTVEDLKGSLQRNITEMFCLPPKMGEKYTAIVFLARNQFEISKRKLNHLSLEDFIYCANQMLKNWSSVNGYENDSDFCRNFLIDLKDLRILTEREFIDDHKKLVITGVIKAMNLQSVRDNRSVQMIEHLFKDVSKSLIEIAYGLNHNKDMKDLFVDLIERFIEPCQDENLNKNEVKVFLEEYRKRAHQLHDVCRDNPKLLTVFDRYISTIISCLLQMYHN